MDTGDGHVWLTEHEAADRARVNADTMRRWRRQGTGPEWHRAGARLVRYRATDVDAWIEQGVRR